jgi:hypothetical protein
VVSFGHQPNMPCKWRLARRKTSFETDVVVLVCHCKRRQAASSSQSHAELAPLTADDL